MLYCINIMYCGYIYQIVADGIDKVYFGSTTQTLIHRFQSHTRRKNCSSKQLFSFPNVRIEKIEECFNDDKALLKKEIVEIEGEYIRRCREIKPNTCVNIRLPNSSHNDFLKYQRNYDTVNKEKRKKNKQIWYENHKEQISLQRKSIRDAMLLHKQPLALQ